ncbi:MAG: cupredoxin domain-containing protein [Bdellovibrionales bacterium]|nr:cupredoxin domain-containing protein [Bdellovibrionales bacterium]
MQFVSGFVAQADWDVDFSRRTKELRKKDYVTPPTAKKDKSIFEHIFESSQPIQEVVLLNTERGFVPSSLSLRQGSTYKIHVVNVNKKSKNISFILNAFSEHHATYYGKVKSFVIQPKKDGVYSFQCPETSAQGRLVVIPHSMQKMPQPPGEVEMRTPASASWEE